MAQRQIDLPRIQRALAELDRIAAAHPELLGDGPKWTAEAVEEAMTPAKERMKAFRQRRIEQGYRRISFFADQRTRDALEALRARAGDKTIDEILSEVLLDAALKEGFDQ